MFSFLTRKKAALGVANVPNTSRKPTLEPSVIASNVNVLGNIISDGVLDIDAQIDGNVTAQLVTVRPNGRIRGDLTAVEVFVHGTVDGLIKAQSVNLFSTATVNGTIMHETLMIEDGASVNGKLKRTEIALPMAEIPLSADPLLSTGPSIPVAANDSSVSYDHDEPVTEKEIKILENLRLIS